MSAGWGEYKGIPGKENSVYEDWGRKEHGLSEDMKGQWSNSKLEEYVVQPHK